MKIAIIWGAQGNFQAAKTALEILPDCQKILHLGDTIGLGPDPRKTLELFLEKEVICLRGLWEERVLNPTSPQEEWNSREIEDLLPLLGRLPYRFDDIAKTAFLYWTRNWRGFTDPPASRAPRAIARALRKERRERVFFARVHQEIIIQEKQTFYNPGSLGLHPLSFASAFIFDSIEKTVQERSSFYDPSLVRERFLQQKPPASKSFL